MQLPQIVVSSGRLGAIAGLFYTIYSAPGPLKPFFDAQFGPDLRHQFIFILLAFFLVEILFLSLRVRQHERSITEPFELEIKQLKQQNDELRKAPLEIGSKPLTLTEADFEPALIAYIKSLIAKKSYRHVIRIHTALSRYLWVEGLLNARAALGQASETAASQLEDKIGQLGALIDDLGWTLVAKKDFENARKRIEYGQHLAKKWNEPYWVAKSYRHLSGMHTIQRNFGPATAALDDAENAAKGIQSRHDKNEMLAGIQYGRAIVELMRGEYDDAMAHLEKSDQLRLKGGDLTRMVRSFALRGKILLAKNDPVSLGQAKTQFQLGLTRATELGRRDEIIRNHYGLAKVFQIEGDKENADIHRTQARELTKDTPVPYEVEDE